MQDVAQRHEKAYPRQRHARRHADRGDQLGPPVRIRRREVRERIHRRLLQHQAFHGHRTDRIGRGEHAHGSARRRTLGDSDSRHLHFIRRDVGSERLGAVHGCAARNHLPLALVSAQGAGNLLRIFLGKPQPRRVLLLHLRGEHRFDSRLAGRILRVCDCRRHRSRHRAADAPRHARIEGTAARGDAGARRAGNRAGVIRKRDSEAGIADACGVDSRGRERIHVHIPLCHQRVGRVVPAGGERLLRCAGHIHRIDKRPAGNHRNRIVRMVFRQAVQGGPAYARPDIRRTEFRGADSVHIRRRRIMGERPQHGAVRHCDRRADLFPRRADGRRHRAAEGDGCRAGSGRRGQLHRGGTAGRGERMAHRRKHYGGGERREDIRLLAGGDLLDRGIRDFVPPPAPQQKEKAGRIAIPNNRNL